MKRRKLLVTASTFPRWSDDTEPRFVLDLCRNLTEEFDVTVLVPAAPNALDEEIIDGVHVVRYHYFPIHKWETLCYPGAIVPRIKEKKRRILLVPFLFLALYYNLLKKLPEYDIVHAHWLIPQGIVQSFFKKPYIVTGHGGDVTSLNISIMKKAKARCIEKASYVTVVSHFLEEKVQEIRKTDKIAVMPMGCDTSNFSSKHRVENLFGQGNDKVVLFVGRLAEKKGVKYLIRAMSNIDAKLVIVGKGPLEEELKSEAKKCGGKVLFMGAKTHEELRAIYASADVFVAPSVTAGDGDREGFGLVMLEAMASGIPVVAFESGGISEVIKHEKNGLLCKEKDVQGLEQNILRILNEPVLYNKLVSEGQKTVQEYDYREVASRYTDVYMKALQK